MATTVFPQAPLTEREWEVASHIVAGLLNKEIARDLGISTQTVKNHIVNISRKLQFGNRTQIAVWAIATGWSRPDLAAPIWRDSVRPVVNSRDPHEREIV